MYNVSLKETDMIHRRNLFSIDATKLSVKWDTFLEKYLSWEEHYFPLILHILLRYEPFWYSKDPLGRPITAHFLELCHFYLAHPWHHDLNSWEFRKCRIFSCVQYCITFTSTIYTHASFIHEKYFVVCPETVQSTFILSAQIGHNDLCRYPKRQQYR